MMNSAVVAAMELSVIDSLLELDRIPAEELGKIVRLMQRIQASCNGEECSAEDLLTLLYAKYGVI